MEAAPLSNKDFAGLLFTATVGLFLAALALALLYVLFLTNFKREFITAEFRQDIQPVSLVGAMFRPRLSGGSFYEANDLIVTGLKNGEAVAIAHVSFSTQDYFFLQVDTEGLHSNLRLFVFWHTRENPDGVFYAEVPTNPNGTGWLNLRSQDLWDGTIESVEVGVYGDLQNSRFRLRAIEFHPFSFRAILETIWTEWNHFSPWDHSSINAYQGTTTQPLAYPTTAVILWFFLGIFFTFLLDSFFRLRPSYLSSRKSTWIFRREAAVVTLSLCWAMMIALWTPKIFLQIKETNTQFYGKSTEDKKLSDWDSAYYQLSQAIKKLRKDDEEALSILIPSGTQSLGFAHRLRYHLLPEVSTLQISQADRSSIEKMSESSNLTLILANGRTTQERIKQELLINTPGITFDQRYQNSIGLLVALKKETK